MWIAPYCPLLQMRFVNRFCKPFPSTSQTFLSPIMKVIDSTSVKQPNSAPAAQFSNFSLIRSAPVNLPLRTTFCISLPLQHLNRYTSCALQIFRLLTKWLTPRITVFRISFPTAPSPINTEDMAQEADHLRAVKRLRSGTGDAYITRVEEEEGSARISKVRAWVSAKPAEPPAWAVPLLASFSATRIQMQAMVSSFGRIDAQFASIAAAKHNNRAMVFNARGSAYRARGVYHLMRLVKEKARLRRRPAWAPRESLDPQLDPAVAVVGKLRAPTLANLASLAMFYNDTFGIVSGDDFPTKLDEFAAFIGLTNPAYQ
ncbi:hypothetical protein DFS34DRAFT_593998 [Phlyctochytrium arcticum]|nr:hypothetical protein DFS34DRAFT_593998 [Phlyctochytrium arcticum]